jgi:hypothetical protein
VARIQSPAAAEIAGLSLRTIQARAPEIPGAAKLFGRWTFDPVKLIRWLADMEGVAQCRGTSIVGAPSGGAASRLPEPSIVEAYERAIGLKPAIASRHGKRSWNAPRISGSPGAAGKRP